MNPIAFVVLLGCFAVFKNAGAQYIEAPVDVAAMVGDDVNFTCLVNTSYLPGFEWSRLGRDRNTERIYYDRTGYNKNPEKYAVHGQFNLLIKNVQLSDGAEYSCDLDVVGNRQKANLFVFDSTLIAVPRLVENVPVDVECLSTFDTSPDLPPELDPAIMLSIKGSELTDLRTTLIESTQHQPYTLRGVASYYPEESDSGSDMVCTVITPSPPGYTVTNRTTVYQIHYNPRNKNKTILGLSIALGISSLITLLTCGCRGCRGCCRRRHDYDQLYNSMRV